MSFFRISSYTDKGDIMLVRFHEVKIPGEGLPPMSSQTIMMNEDEIEKLKEVLNAYERRNP
jgi:hypothetical protein